MGLFKGKAKAAKEGQKAKGKRPRRRDVERTNAEDSAKDGFMRVRKKIEGWHKSDNFNFEGQD